ncbi:MAG: pentapeptide repeat-containing protein [Akkermansiaceae bacterium]
MTVWRGFEKKGVSPMTSEQQAEHDALTGEIIGMQKELAALVEAEKKSRQRAGRFARYGNRTLLYLFLGPRLTHRLGELLYVAKEKKEPILGTSLARVLDSASRRMTGYKRWAVIFGIIAAIPGIISMTLLWQQNKVVKRETYSRIADIENRERLDLLLTIYTSEDKDPNSALLTPSYPALLRSEAALKLIKMDSKTHLEHHTKLDPNTPDYWRVNLSNAPLARVNLSPLDPRETRVIERVDFGMSNLFSASLSHCQISDCWFDGAALGKTEFADSKLIRCSFKKTAIMGVDFTDTVFIDCNFQEAMYDKNTRWPEGFDPVAAGALALPASTQEGDAK